MRDFSAGLTVECATVEPLEFRCCKGYSLSHMPPPGSWSACRIAHRAARGCYETVRLVRYEITGQKVLRNYETLQMTGLTQSAFLAFGRAVFYLLFVVRFFARRAKKRTTDEMGST